MSAKCGCDEVGPGVKVLAVPRGPPGAARAFLRGSRGGASLVLVIGIGVLLTTAAACFDLYARVAAGSGAGRAAATMGEYVAREEFPAGDQIEALGRYLQKHQLGAPADLVFVVSAIRRAPAASGLPTEPQVLWGEAIEVPLDPEGEGVTTELAAACGRFGTEGGPAVLPPGFDMVEGEVTVVAEVCVRPRAQGAATSAVLTGDIYRVFALPPRDPANLPSPPVHIAGVAGGS